MQNRNYSEKLLEELIRRHPAQCLGEDLTLLSQQPTIGGFRPDLVFLNAVGDTVIVEVQIHALDRAHLYRALEYRDLYAVRSIKSRVVVVCNSIRSHHEQIAKLHGVALVEIPRAKCETMLRELMGIRVKRPRATLRIETFGDVLRGLQRTASPLVNTINDAIVFWTRSWSDRRDDYGNLQFAKVSEHKNPGAGYFSHLRLRPMRKRPSQNRSEFLSVPCEWILQRSDFERLTTDVLSRMRAWLTWIGKYAVESAEHDETVVLGFRTYPDVAFYEEYVKGRIRLLREFAYYYGRNEGWDAELIKADLLLLNRIRLLSGKFPDLDPITLCHDISVEGGAGPLTRDWNRERDVFVSWGHRATDVSKAIETLQREWLTITFRGLTGPYLRVFEKLIVHLFAHAADKKGVRFSNQCWECLARPRELKSITPEALARSARYFAHVAPPQLGRQVGYTYE